MGRHAAAHRARDPVVVVIGWLTVGPLLFGDYFQGCDLRRVRRTTCSRELGEEFHGPVAVRAARVHSRRRLAGRGRRASSAWFLYLKRPICRRGCAAEVLGGLYRVLDEQVLLRRFNENVIASGRAASRRLLWKVGDVTLIDGAARERSARRRSAGRRASCAACRAATSITTRSRWSSALSALARLAPLADADDDAS